MQRAIIQKIHVTEKTSRLQEQGQYVILVDPAATKNEIKKALKADYKVDVVKITTLRMQAVRRRYRGKLSLKQSPKKAMVTLKEGQKIETT